MFIEDSNKNLIKLKDASASVRSIAIAKIIMSFLATDEPLFKNLFNSLILSYLLDTDNLKSFRVVKDLKN